MSAAVEILPIQSNEPPPPTISVPETEEKLTDETNENDNEKRNPAKIKKRRKSIHACPYNGCNKKFNKPSRLTWHIRLHTGEKPFACTHENCTKSYRTSSHLKRHQETHKVVEERLVCDICQLTLKTRQNLAKHRRRVHEDNSRLRCKECGLVFRKKYCLERHKVVHQGKLYTCDTCQTEYADLTKFNRHMKTHVLKYTCKAENCDAKFDKFLEYRRHIASHKEHRKRLKHRLQAHKRDNTVLLSCPYENCTRIYCYQKNLNHHIRSIHQKIKKYECDICKKRYVSMKPLRHHIKTIHMVDDDKNDGDKNLSEGQKKQRKRRRDAGQPKWSMPTKLAGLKLPCEMEKVLINRDSTVQLSEDNFSNDK